VPKGSSTRPRAGGWWAAAAVVTALASGAPGPVSPTPATASAPVARSRPNIVVVMADDMRADDLRFAPYTSRLMARTGVRFENSFSPYPLCCPARASFLTGLYAHNHHVFSHESPWGFKAFDDHRTVAGRLHDAGYATGFVGKYLNGYGTQRSLVTGRPSLRYVPKGWTDWYGAVEPPHGSGIHGGTYNYFDTPFNVNGRIDNTHRGDYQTDVIGQFGRDLVDRYHDRRQPFFLYLSFVAPHFGGPAEADDPVRVHASDGVLDDMRTPARPGWVRGHFDRQVRRPPGLTRSGVSEADMSDKPAFMAGLPELTRRERRALTEVTRQRAEAILVLDQEVRRLVSQLRATHEWDDTVLVFTSDNGYFLGEHRQRTGKIKAHEPSLRVPLLATGPGIVRGARRYDPISTVDLTATVLDLAGVPDPGGDGASRAAVMRGDDRGWHTAVATEGRIQLQSLIRSSNPGFTDPRNSIGVRTGRYSFITYRNGARELYDLASDPNQLRNVVADPAYAGTLAELEDVWWQLKDCAGSGCRAALPADLQLDARAERTLTQHYWREVRRRSAS
jgi:N-acetylglucosamine-6-sulfatase